MEKSYSCVMMIILVLFSVEDTRTFIVFIIHERVLIAQLLLVFNYVYIPVKKLCDNLVSENILIKMDLRKGEFPCLLLHQ